MGLVHAKTEIANPLDPSRWKEIETLVDTGDLYSILPAELLEGLGIRRQVTRMLRLADGRTVSRDLGEARFRLEGEEATSRVVFGQPGDAVVLGAVTIESLALTVDPATGRIGPMETLLAVGFRVASYASVRAIAPAAGTASAGAALSSVTGTATAAGFSATT